MIVYFDTSALIKAYVQEPSTDAVRALMATIPRKGAAGSIVVYAEMRAALATATRGLRLTPNSYAATLAEFEADWREMRHIDVDEPLVRVAGQLAEDHALRGFDAIHLASAVILAREIDEAVMFSAFDDRLVAAAVACGLVAA